MSHEAAQPEPSLSRARRLQAALIGWAGARLVRFIGATLRYRVEGWENFRQFEAAGRPVILSFWHNQIFSATHFWRRRGIVVMTSRHFDGEYIAWIIRGFGYRPARGSSSRGGVRALLELKRCLGNGHDVAFTIDGPRGPRYVVKEGPLWLSRQTGAPVICFHVEPRSFWSLRSWDRFRIPKPFTPVLVKVGRPLTVPEGGDEKEWLGAYQEEMDRLRNYCQAHWLRRTDPD